jgi:hypothetical protein
MAKGGGVFKIALNAPPMALECSISNDLKKRLSMKPPAKIIKRCSIKVGKLADLGMLVILVWLLCLIISTKGA